jgi:outer membrane receptor protein involved in Fe transport
VFDAAVTAALTAQLSVQLRVENLFDAHYLVNAYHRMSRSPDEEFAVGWPGAPRNVRLRVTAAL